VADATEELRNPLLDVGYATGADYRLEQGFDDNAHTQEARDGAESSLSQPQPTQFGLYSNVNARPAPYIAISDPGIHTAIPIGREYLNPATTAGYYSSLSISSVTNEMNNLGLSGQASYPPISGSECKYAHSYQIDLLNLLQFIEEVILAYLILTKPELTSPKTTKFLVETMLMLPM
jgi:hypothetical protein